MPNSFEFVVDEPFYRGTVRGSFEFVPAVLPPSPPPPPPSSIDPATLENRKLDLLAGTATCFSDFGSTPAAVGSAVVQWNDQSGNGRNATQSTAECQPTLQQNGGAYVVRFDGSDPTFEGFADRLMLGADLSVLDHTIYVVYARTGTVGAALLGQASSAASMLGIGTGQTTFYRGNNQSKTFTGGGAAGTKAVAAFVRNGATVNVWNDGAKAPETLTLTVPTASFNVREVSGASQDLTNPISPYTGDLHRVLVFDGTHDDATVQAVSQWLAAN